MVDVALLDDELNDGGGGDGVEAAGGRVVEQQIGMIDEGAGDGDAALHASGEAGGKEGEGLLEADEGEGFVDAGVDFVVGDEFLNQLIADIVADGEGVKESAFLEDHADAGAQGELL